MPTEDRWGFLHAAAAFAQLGRSTGYHTARHFAFLRAALLEALHVVREDDRPIARALFAARDRLLGVVDAWDPWDPLLWSHDMTCVIGDLSRGAHAFAYDVDASAMQDLRGAAISFALQLALEAEPDLDAAELRVLEQALRAAPVPSLELPTAEADLGHAWEPLPRGED